MIKKHKHIIIYFFILLAGSSFQLGNAQKNLEIYLQTIAQNNPGLKVKFNEYMAALEQVPQVKALPDPQIAFAYFIQPIETRMGPQKFKISINQMFPWFGTLKAKGNAATELAKAKYEMFEDAKLSLFHDFRSAYYSLYFNEKAREINKSNLELLLGFKNLAEVKLEAGLVSAVDLYRIEMEIGDLKNQLAYLSDKSEVLNADLRKFLNFEPNAELVLDEELPIAQFSKTKQNLLDSLKTRNHKLLSISIQQQALQYRKEVAKNMGKPNINIGFDYAFIGTGDNKMPGTDAIVFPKVGISVPLYRKKYKAMINEVVYLEKAKSNQHANVENILETLIEKAWAQWEDAKRREVLFTKQSKLAQKSLAILETSYAASNKGFEEILRMERKLLKYSLEKEKAKTDQATAVSFLNYLSSSRESH